MMKFYRTIRKIKMKKETLEQAAEKYDGQFEYAEDSSPQIDFIEGAKWQQERMYTKEDLEVAFSEGQFGKYSFNDWFEQFKS